MDMIPDTLKVLVRQSLLSNMTFEQVIKVEFRKNGIENILNDSFEANSGDNTDDDMIIQKMQQQGPKIAYVLPEDCVKLVLRQLRILLLNET